MKAEIHKLRKEHGYYMNMKDYNMNEDFDRFPPAMAYVPWQRLSHIYEDLDEAYMNGTIFPELNKPFSGRRCCK